MNQTRSGAPRGRHPLHPRQHADRNVLTGYQHGCPGAQVHLGMRFQGKPASGVDGAAFPRAEWEQSPFFTPQASAVGLAGVAGVDVASIALPAAPAAPPAGGRAAPRTAPVIDPVRWRELLRRSAAVTAQWFLVHDTGGGRMPTAAPHDASGGIHLFIGSGSVLLAHDFSARGAGTKFEKRAHHPEFHGHIVHMEIVNTSTSTAPNPPDSFGADDYLYAAMAYVFASYRASQWLTVTCHLEVDRGIPNGHCDPRGFQFSRLYERVGALVPSVAGKTFGILQERIGNNTNQTAMQNTFPAQYGPVRNESRLRG